MMMPRRRDFDIFEDIFKDSIFNIDESKIMKTDIKEHDDNYSIIVDLPGYNKENIKISIEDGYLIVHATMDSDNEKNDGKFVRKERYFGECSRSFYIGDNITTEELKASFKNGTLRLEVPKKEIRKEISEKKYVQIDD